MTSVVRRITVSTPSASTTTAMVSPGLACSKTEQSSSAGWAVAVLPTVLMRGSTRLSALAPMALSAVATARLLRPVTARRSMPAVPSTPLASRAACHASAAAGPKTWGAEALLPRARARVARDPPALGDLERAGRSAEVFGQHRSIGVVAHQRRGGAVTGRGLVGASGQAVTGVSGHHEGGITSSQRSVQRTDAGSDRAPEVER